MAGARIFHICWFMTDGFFVNKRVVAFAVLLGLFMVAGPENGFAENHSAGFKPLVVVELFTSQGCSSCPPADEFLKDLSVRDDVLALSLHVDYWDYIGWKDPFAKPEFTNRQRQYAGVMRLRYVYTPQMVVQGIYQAVGSRRGDVLDFIEKAKADTGNTRGLIDLARVNGDLRVRLGQQNVPGTVDVYAVFV